MSQNPHVLLVHGAWVGGWEFAPEWHVAGGLAAGHAPFQEDPQGFVDALSRVAASALV